MAFTRYASLDSAEVLDIKGAATQQHFASLDKLSEFDTYRTGDGFLYARIRAISSRVNKNSDSWPSVELAGSPEILQKHHTSGSGFTVEASEGNPEYGFATFVGKPVFVDHHNSNPKKARGVIVDSKLNVLDHKTASKDSYWSSHDVDREHLPPTEVELLLEIDAKSFPRLAQAIISGDLDGFSMGADVEKSKCSHCGHIATNPEEFCSHILMKGAHHDFKTADGKRVSKKSFEHCYGVRFFEISAVFDPADPTAKAREVRAAVNKEADIKTAENPLPQEFMTRAPEEIDTLRDQQICPVCGNDEMQGESCQVCGFVQEPKGFDNPDLSQATKIREEMKQKEEQASEGQPPPTQPGEQIGEPQPNKQQGGPLTSQQPTKAPMTSAITNEMRWTPKVHPKTAARINQIERPITPSNPPQTNEPRGATVISDQLAPVTSATVTQTMQTAQQLMANAKRNHGETMNTYTADATSPGDTAPKTRTDVTGVGGFDDASNEAASSPGASTDVTGIGSIGLTDVGPAKTETIPTAGQDSNDSGFNTDKTTDDSGPTSTWGDSDGSHSGVSDPVTSEPFPASEDGVKLHSNRRWAYEDGTLEALDQQGDPIAGGGSAVQGVQPITESFGDRVNVLEHKTSPSNNSGPTKTWTGTDGNGVLKQQDPVTRDTSDWGGINVPDVQLHTTGMVSLAALRLTEMEIELGLLPREQKWTRLAETNALDQHDLNIQIDALGRVKTAGLNKLAQHRTATRLPKAFGKSTAAPNGFERIATGSTPVEQQPLSDDALDAGLFLR
jgi:hypothetical protein